MGWIVGELKKRPRIPGRSIMQGPKPGYQLSGESPGDWRLETVEMYLTAKKSGACSLKGGKESRWGLCSYPVGFPLGFNYAGLYLVRAITNTMEYR